jgi:acetyl-CoA carboxylase/biotin carboxylase 1
MIIFANWRGFSGGQSDMSKEILKFGAQIVDALREFKQPIFIYIIGELRGGAWVVLDPSINSEMMEMYSYENGRGGVLEPQGIVEIKYRTPRVIATMERLDQECRKMKESMNVSNITDVEKSGIAEQLKTREKFLLPLYEQAAVEFADLHDRPARMLGKEVVRQVIPWESSREFFYWRIIRRLNTKNLIKRMNAAANLESRDAEDLINSWFKIEYPNGTDKEFAIWYSVASAAIQDRIHRLQQISIRDQISNLAKDSPAAFMEALETSFQSLTGKERQDILDRLSR